MPQRRHASKYEWSPDELHIRSRQSSARLEKLPSEPISGTVNFCSCIGRLQLRFVPFPPHTPKRPARQTNQRDAELCRQALEPIAAGCGPDQWEARPSTRPCPADRALALPNLVAREGVGWPSGRILDNLEALPLLDFCFNCFVLYR